MIHTVNNQVVSDYIQTNRNRSNMNKNRELRSIYHAIVQINSHSPIYMFRLSEEKLTYALTLKDSAIALNTILNQYDANKDSSVFQLKKADSSNPAVVNAEIINDDYENLPDEFTIKVNHLASAQINIGREVSSYNNSLPAGAYSYTLNIEDNLYEFQYTVAEKSTNKENLVKLVNFMNQANVGIMASLAENSKNQTSQIYLKSIYPGAIKPINFTFHDTQSVDSSRGIADYFGFNTVSEYPKNTSFELNGIEKESLSNSFTYSRSLKITLNSESDEVISIHYAPDTDKILHSLSILTNSYNQLVNVISGQALSQKASSYLLNDLNSLSKDYQHELESCGLRLNKDNNFIVDEALSLSAAKDGTIKKLLTAKDGYVKRLQQRAKKIILDPMNYLDKTVVTYPNTEEAKFPNSYISSVYSGILFNYFC